MVGTTDAQTFQIPSREQLALHAAEVAAFDQIAVAFGDKIHDIPPTVEQARQEVADAIGTSHPAPELAIDKENRNTINLLDDQTPDGEMLDAMLNDARVHAELRPETLLYRGASLEELVRRAADLTVLLEEIQQQALLSSQVMPNQTAGVR